MEELKMTAMYNTWTARGCQCSLKPTRNGEHVDVCVYRLDNEEVGETVRLELFNPYAFFGFDYEDCIQIDETLENLLDSYGDPLKYVDIYYTSHIYEG